VKRLAFAGDDRLRVVEVAGAKWFDALSLWRPIDPDLVTTGAHEVAAVLLGGTFDLVGGGTAWPARGARKDAFGGRPMAVFLPPATPFQASKGQGEILLVAARQPAAQPTPQGREALAHKPLLPLAGSGKSFDPNSGEWKPAETFPTAPESLPPRRFERIAVGDVVVERMFAPDYKAATLSVDEAVVPAGGALRLGDVPGRPMCDETLLFVRAPHGATVEHDGRSETITGDGVVLLPFDGRDAVVRADAGPCFVVVSSGGK
jgi:hypothetical protein